MPFFWNNVDENGEPILQHFSSGMKSIEDGCAYCVYCAVLIRATLEITQTSAMHIIVWPE